jgi:hypothetical protein
MSDKPTILEYDGLTKTEIIRELTESEITDREEIASQHAVIQAQQQATRASALAKLAALGLTEEEIAAL